MVRPRPGDSAYSAEEFAEMRESIKEIKGKNVQGIVIGVLLPNGSIDRQRTRELVPLASPMQVDVSPRFDETQDLAATLEEIVLTGAHRILTSGGAADAPSGVSVLRISHPTGWKSHNDSARRRTPCGQTSWKQPAQPRPANCTRASAASFPTTSQDLEPFESAVRDWRQQVSKGSAAILAASVRQDAGATRNSTQEKRTLLHAL